MTEVIAEYEESVTAEDGSTWAPRVCARECDGRWEGWIEFIPLTVGHTPVRTPPETTQADRDAMIGWATGLGPAYLQGAIERALERPAVLVAEPAPPLFDTPAPTIGRAHVVGVSRPRPLLDPFEVHAQGEQRLLDQLEALSTEQIRDIVLAYGLASMDTAVIASRAQLIAHVLTAVRASRDTQRG